MFRRAHVPAKRRGYNRGVSSRKKRDKKKKKQHNAIKKHKSSARCISPRRRADMRVCVFTGYLRSDFAQVVDNNNNINNNTNNVTRRDGTRLRACDRRQRYGNDPARRSVSVVRMSK